LFFESGCTVANEALALPNKSNNAGPPLSPPWSIADRVLVASPGRFIASGANPVPIFGTINSRRELNMTALQGWIVIGLLVLITLGIVGLGAELQVLPYLWRTSAEEIK
jgi:hypothetical protein